MLFLPPPILHQPFFLRSTSPFKKQQLGKGKYPALRGILWPTLRSPACPPQDLTPAAEAKLMVWEVSGGLRDWFQNGATSPLDCIQATPPCGGQGNIPGSQTQTCGSREHTHHLSSNLNGISSSCFCQKPFQ